VVRIPEEWRRSNLARDVAVIEVLPIAGKSLEQTLGGCLIPLINSKEYRLTENLGYPRNFGETQVMIQSKGMQSQGRFATPIIKKTPSRMTFGLILWF
jgi:hypothetical protein